MFDYLRGFMVSICMDLHISINTTVLQQNIAEVHRVSFAHGSLTPTYGVIKYLASQRYNMEVTFTDREEQG